MVSTGGLGKTPGDLPTNGALSAAAHTPGLLRNRGAARLVKPQAAKEAVDGLGGEDEVDVGPMWEPSSSLPR
jgi:hypothetical protein